MPGQDTNPADLSSDINVELDNSWENGRPSSSPTTVNRESDAHQETSASNTTNDNSFQLCQNRQLEDSSDWSRRLPSTSAPSSSRQSLTHDDPGPATSTSNSTFRNYIYGGSSDSGSESDDAQVNCPVCFVSLLNREVATPDTCQHYFCCPCLKQWSTTVTTCPVDRRKFKLILVRNNIGGQVIRVDPVEPVSVRSFGDGDDDYDDPTYCQVCHQSDREDRMLLCDYCDSGFHLECLNPPLDEVPDGDWFCSRCQLLDTRNTEQSQGRVTWVRVPTFPVGLGGRSVQCVRVPPVNRQVEEIISVSSDDESEVEIVTRSGRRIRRPSVSSNSDSARPQRKTLLIREPVEPSIVRKKVSRRIPSLRGEGSFSHTRRRRQQNTSESSRQTVEDSDEDGDVRTARRSRRSRLAENLGLVPCRRSYSSSTTNASAPASCLNRQRVSAGIPTLHLFGSDSLDYFSDGSDGETGNEGGGGGSRGGGSRVLCHRSRSSPTTARRLAARKLSQSLMGNASRPRVNLNPRPSTSRDTTSSSHHNLLDSIMESQGLWHSRNTTMSLARDGTITIEKAPEVERPSEAMPSSNNGPRSSTVTEPSDRYRDRIQNDSNPQEFSSPLFTRRDTIGVAPVTNRISNIFTSRAGSSRSFNSARQQTNVNRFPWESHTSNRISLTDNQTRVSQVPLYPGNSNNSRSPGSSGSYHNNDSQYERSSTSSYQYSGHTYSSTRQSGFDSERGHLGYSGYLGPENSSTSSDLPNSGRFSLLPPYTVRRTQPHPSTSLSTSRADDRQLEESDFLDDPDVSSGKSSNERDSKKNTYRKVTEDDDLDIYSDIEVSSTGEQNCASEHEDNERSFDVLPPPPEPSALLIGLGVQDSSDSETNDSLVIDIRPNPDDHIPKDNATKSPDESEKYDPAVPCDDSDDDEPVVSQNKQKEDIPLPPCPPSLEKIDVSTSNASYLQSPTYGELSKQCSVHVTEAVTEAVKEAISSTLQSSSASINKALASGDEDDDEGECPNFSIYSADSMDIARKATEIPEENSDALDKSDTATTEQVKVDVEKCETKTDILEVPVELGSDQNNQESRDNDEQMEETGSISEMRQEPLENNDDVIEQLSKNLHCSSRSSSSCSSSSSSCCSSSSSSSGSSSSSSDDGSSISQNTSCEEPNKDATSEEKDVKTVSVEQTGDQTSNVNDVKSVVSGASENCEKSAIGDENGAKDHEIVELDESVEKENLVVGRASAVPVVSSDNAIGTQNKTALSLDNTASSLNSSLPAATPAGLEGLETETISETEEAINFDDDMSHDETSLLSEEDGEISPRKKKKKKATDEVKDSTKVDISVSVEKPVLAKDLSPDETVDYEEGEIIDERPTPSDVAQKDKILDKDKRHGSNEIRSADEAEMSESSVHIGTEGEKKKKKKKSSDRDRAELSVNDDDAGKGKGGTLDDSISWKKPSKGTKERNYRDSKSVKPTEKGKDGSRKENEDKELPKKDKKKKEKRKDMERYDVRKIVSDKKRKRKDEFGRDLSRDRSYSRSRSRSKSRGKSRDRSTSLSRSKTNRTKGRSSPGRSRHRSRSRSRSRSYRSRSRSKNKSLSKLKDRSRKSRSKERQRKSSRDRSRSRNRRSRSRSGSRLRNRSRSRSIHKSREGKDRSRAAVRQKRPPKNRRSWSRTWTPSWSRSRSRSRSVSGSSYSRSPSPSARRYNRSYSRSFSRSWSRERHERVPLMEKKTNTVSKPPKNLTVIVNNSKEDSERQRKKEKKKKDSRKSKDQSGAEKRKKRKERSPLPSKEVFTSGDNILVSVNFNKSNKGPGAKDAAVAAAAAVTSASICALPKDSSKRKQRDDAFDVARETPKKTRKDKSGKEKTSKGLNSNAANSDKTQNRRSKKATKADKRLAALLRQKPVAIIDLDQSPFREQTPSPRDLIVLSDSDETQRDKETEMEDGIMARMMHQEILSPQNSLKMSATARTPESQSPVMSSVGNYLNTSTGPKTPPEPQIKFSIAAKPQLRSISNPLREEDDDLMAEDTVLDESDRQMHEDLDRDIMHKGPNTPPEPRGPTTPCSPPISPDAYDPFDPTKSGTPSPVREEVNIDELQSPSGTPCEEVMQHPVGVTDSPIQSDLDDNAKKTLEISSEIPLLQSSDNLRDDVTHSPDRSKSITMIETMLGKSPSNIDESVAGASQHQLQVEVSPSEPGEKSSSLSVTMIVPINSDITPLSPEIKIIPMTVQQQKLLKQNIVQQQPVTSTPTHCSTPSNYATLPTSIASTPISPLTSTPVSRSNVFSTPVTITVPQLSSHHLVSPVVSQQRAVGIKTVPEKVTSISYVKNVPQRTTGQQNGDQKEQIQDISTEVVDMDLDSPYSPGSSEGDDLFEPPSEIVKPTASYPPMNTRSSQTPQKNVRQSLPALGNTPNKPPDKFDALFGMSPARNKGSAKMGKFKTHHSRSGKMKGKLGKGSKKEIQIKMDEDQLQILDDLPSSAVELQVKDKFLKKLNRQERVVEEVKLSLKPYYTSKKINKEEYKEILRRSVPKICHNRSGEINPKKISALVDAYVLKYRYLKKKQVSSQRKQAKPPRFDIDSSHTSGH